MNLRNKTILHVDDDADDRELLRETMNKIAPEIKVTFSENGLKALEYLNENNLKNSLPCLIVLDLNMPYLNGRETFERIKSDSKFSEIPLVILSSGENPSDKALFSKESIPYFNKPYDFLAMENLAKKMAELCC